MLKPSASVFLLCQHSSLIKMSEWAAFFSLNTTSDFIDKNKVLYHRIHCPLLACNFFFGLKRFICIKMYKILSHVEGVPGLASRLL